MKKLLIMAALAALTGCVSIPSSDTAVVVIGVENSKTYGSCPGARADSDRMAKILSGHGKVEKFQDEQATRVNILNALARGSSKDLIIVYYSGHGGQAGKGDASEADKKDEYLCLSDGPLYDNEIWSIICSAKRTMLIIDACHSETMYRSLCFKAMAARIAGNKGEFLCWSGCPDNAYSYGGIGGGQFTNALRRHYKSLRTYGRVWKEIANDGQLLKLQYPRKTSFGDWDDKLVFR